MEPLQHAEPIECIGVDPGLVNHAICHIRFSGYRYERAPGTEDTMQKTPQFEILNWELWNLKSKVVYAPNAERRVHTEKYENSGTSSDSLQVMAQNMAHVVQTTAWLRDRAVQLVSELQCAHVKSSEIDAYVMAHLLVGCVATQDRQLGLGVRRIVSEARKYGLPSDGALTYDQRKRKSEEIARNLLRLTGKRDWVTFLDLCESAQRRDRPGKTPQSHDLCDALLLALQHCTTEWEAREKRDDNAVHVVDQPAMLALFDSEEDDALVVKPKRKRRAPQTDPVKRKRVAIALLDDSDESTERDSPPVLRQRKKAKTCK